MLERADDGEELAIPDQVVSFCLGEGGGVIAYGVSQSVRVALVEDGACCKLGCVNLQFEGFVVIRLSVTTFPPSFLIPPQRSPLFLFLNVTRRLARGPSYLPR